MTYTQPFPVRSQPTVQLGLEMHFGQPRRRTWSLNPDFSRGSSDGRSTPEQSKQAELAQQPQQ